MTLVDIVKALATDQRMAQVGNVVIKEMLERKNGAFTFNNTFIVRNAGDVVAIGVTKLEAIRTLRHYAKF